MAFFLEIFFCLLSAWLVFADYQYANTVFVENSVVKERSWKGEGGGGHLEFDKTQLCFESKNKIKIC